MHEAVTIISFFVITQFLVVLYLAYKRIRNGYNGLSKHITAVVFFLLLIISNSLVKSYLIVDLVHNNYFYELLESFDLVLLTSLLISNTFLYIALKDEAKKPMKKMTPTRQKIYESIE